MSQYIINRPTGSAVRYGGLIGTFVKRVNGRIYLSFDNELVWFYPSEVSLVKEDKMRKSQAIKIEELLSDIDLDIDLTYSDYYKDIDDFDALTDFIEDQGGFNQEVIYYSNAIKYLSENDASLRESLGLAHDMGYSADNLTSEILASILMSENVREDYYQLQNEIEEILQ